MVGPRPRGHWSASRAPNCSEAFGFLAAGKCYRVVRPFRDFDDYDHVAGETWTFLGECFLPYEDGVSLFVSLDGESEWHIRMQWRPEAQAHVLDHLAEFVALVHDP